MPAILLAMALAALMPVNGGNSHHATHDHDAIDRRQPL
jgi:hypothetical protein